MRRRIEKSPIWSDVRQGTPVGMSQGRYVMNDGEAVPPRFYLLLQENGIPIAQEDGKHVYLEDANA